MRKEVVVRFVWPKGEIRNLLIKDLAGRGIEINGETSLSFSDMSAILEIWLPTMPQEKTSDQGEGERDPPENYLKGVQNGKNSGYV